MDGDHPIYSASPETSGQAAYYLVTSLLMHLVRTESIGPDDARLIAAMGALAARGVGQTQAADLIEATIEGARDIDLESEAAALGISIDRTSLQ